MRTFIAQLFRPAPVPAPADRFRFRPNLDALDERIVPTLTLVPRSAGFPYTSIVKVVATFPNGTTWGGTGAVIDGFHVLTAAHNVYNHYRGKWATSIQIIPKMDGTYKPFGTAYATYKRTYASFATFSKNNPPTAGNPNPTATYANDIALLTLNRRVGNQTSWMSWGYDNNNARFAAGRIFNTAGYPGSPYDGQRMYRSGGPIAGLSGDQRAFRYHQSNITTYNGQSGSPVYMYNSSTGSRVIYGVHTGKTGSTNFATRITQSIYNDLQRWRRSDAPPSGWVGGRSVLVGAGFGPDEVPAGGEIGTAESAGRMLDEGTAPPITPATTGGTITAPVSPTPPVYSPLVPAAPPDGPDWMNVETPAPAADPVAVPAPAAAPTDDDLPVGGVFVG
jgi:V8-like Glu-specific endopeptidase